MLLGLQHATAIYQKSWPPNLLQVSKLTFISRTSGLTWCIIQKCLISPLLLALGLRNMKTNYKKSWPANLFKVLNLTFESRFKVKLGYTNKALYLPLVILYQGQTTSSFAFSAVPLLRYIVNLATNLDKIATFHDLKTVTEKSVTSYWS